MELFIPSVMSHHFRLNMSIPDKNWQPPTVNLETSMGEVVVELYWKQAPLSCRNFAELVRRGYYNNTKFHRIIKVYNGSIAVWLVHVLLSSHLYCEVQS